MKGIFVIGAGPAGLFAARKMALAGHDVFLFNRDIKPGGLAEYGIYPRKDKMKAGLRRQFAQILELPNTHYFGHVQVGSEYDLRVEELELWRPAAMVFACGAQGTKRLGLPGENARGVYAAKDFVYHYNQLPPFAAMDFSTGRHIVVVGVGNVAIDIARWLLLDLRGRNTERVTLLARRGPLEIKFDEKEIATVEQHLCREELGGELARVRERCARCGQDVSAEKVLALHFRHLGEAGHVAKTPRLALRFLSSPTAIVPDSRGRIAQLEIAENDLVLKSDGSTAAVPRHERSVLECDTLIFAIGDRHDAKVGLPMGPEGFATEPVLEAAGQHSYQLWDPQSRCPLPGKYVVGWARRASTGLVGIARHDAEMGAGQVLEFVNKMADPATAGEEEIRRYLAAKGLRTVSKADLELLSAAEFREAAARQLGWFHYSSDEAMFQAIEEERARRVLTMRQEAPHAA